jgi:asparagine N-glycosylation enzyme membrane subunit Stt3
MTGWPKYFTGEDKGKNYTLYLITIALVSMLIFPFLSREILLLIFAGAGVYGYITSSNRNITNLIVSVVLLLLISITPYQNT